MLIELLLFAVITILLFLQPLCDLYKVYVQNFPPGPWSLPLIGGLNHLNIKSPHLSVRELAKKYGRIFSVRMGPMGRVVILSDLDLIIQVLENPFSNDRPAMKFLELLSENASGIGSLPYGTKWKRITRLFHRGFAKLPHSSISEQCNHGYGKLLERFHKNSGCPYNPRLDIVKTVTLILCSIVYGEKHESLEAERLNTQLRHHTLTMKGLNPIHPINLFPWLWKFPTPWKKKILQMIEFRDKTFQTSFEKHCEKYEVIQDIMDIAADFKLEDKMADITVNDLFISIWVFYTAGSDNFVDVLHWMILFLCANEHVQKKLQTELDSVLTNNREPSIDDKHELNYTRAVVMETMRLATPTALGVPRMTATDISMEGYNIPKDKPEQTMQTQRRIYIVCQPSSNFRHINGRAVEIPCMTCPTCPISLRTKTTIMIDFWGIHHDEKYWEKPNTFIPERFLDADGLLLDTHTINKLPLLTFSCGKRPCLGKFLAPDLFMLFAARIFKNFNMAFAPGEVPDMRGQFVFSLRPCEFHTIITPRTH